LSSKEEEDLQLHFCQGLFWVAFDFLGLDCLQVEAAKGAISLCCVWKRLKKGRKG
jgi:hypothetical protein